MPPFRQGTGFTNLQTYLGLNRGIAGQMGSALAEDAERAGSGLPGEIRSLEQSTLEDIRGKTLQAPGEGVTSQQATELGQRTYDGPMGLDPTRYADLARRSAAAQNQATALGSNTGRSTLLQQKYGANTWGGGQLDAALAGAGSAAGRLGAASGAYGRLLQTLGGAQANVQSAGRAAADTTGKSAKAYQDMVPGLQQQEQAAAAKKAEEERLRRQEQRYDRANTAAGRRIDNRRHNPDNTPYAP